MKSLYIALLCCALGLKAQEPKSVKTEIKAVTVFFQGAEVERQGRATLPKGISTLVLEGLSPRLDEKSIQFNATADVSVLSTNFQVGFNEQTVIQKQRAETLNKRLKELGEEVKTKQDLLSVSNQEYKLLLDNAEYDKLKDITVAQLEQAINFAKNRMVTIRQAQQKLRSEIESLNETRQKVINELQEIRIGDAKPQGKVLIKLSTSNPQSVSFTLSYTIAEAGWRPYYDIKVTDVGTNLSLAYNAKINQTSGEDWSQVKLMLSTGNPAEAAALADLNPWFLNFVANNYKPYSPPPAPVRQQGVTGNLRGLVIDATTSEAIPFANVVALNTQGAMIAGTTSDVDGNFTLEVNQAAQRLEVSYLGYNQTSQYLNQQTQFYTLKLSPATEQLQEVVVAYQRPLIEKARTTSTIDREDIQQMAVRDVSSVERVKTGVSYDARGARTEANAYNVDGVKVNEFKISRNPINLHFEVSLPYDIPSDGEEYQVQIETYSIPANYSYTATPKLNENAFLTAEIVDWERFNLLDGAAGLYLEGTYLGETQINVSSAEDTLTLSLGKDENIKVLREAVTTEESSSFLGGKRIKNFHYRISVRNTKNVPLNLTVLDQYPVSGNSSIKVERIEHSGAKVNDETGILNWEFKLDPKATNKLDLKYKITYPKGTRINL
jgi:hypothetical protein